jgi:hypothetical protein
MTLLCSTARSPSLNGRIVLLTFRLVRPRCWLIVGFFDLLVSRYLDPSIFLSPFRRAGLRRRRTYPSNDQDRLSVIKYVLDR